MADLLLVDLAGFDGVVVSPGVPLNRHPIAAKAREAGVPIIGDIELFAQARASLPPHKVVGITGTNGKSTTTALIHHILVSAGVPATLGGNIGLPILGQDPLSAGGVYVLELSSYQIDLTQSLDCDVAVLLNITPDHLDRYDGLSGYAASKARLFTMQRARGNAVVDRTADAEFDVLDDASDPAVTFIDTVEIATQAEWPALQGPHNAQNAAAAIAVTRLLGLSEEAIAAGLRTYPGLPHRMERVAEKAGILYINDSKATNATSTAPALAAFPPVAGGAPRIRWILGGRAKTDDLDACAPYFGNVRAAYTIGEAGPMFAKLLRGEMAVCECNTLANAVAKAAAAAEPGEVVMLSPACASFDQFSDFEARGAAFRAVVEEI
jgi:UDP-N-acetylmuramoylalanine--D-glutamate ligase